MSPDGRSGWYAVNPDGSRISGDVVREAPPEGSTIRLMGEHMVEVPLWWDGLIFDAPEDLAREWQVSAQLVSDLVAWASDWHEHAGEPEHDRRAAELVHRLTREMGARYRFVFER
jgi:hypothetical protein